MSGFMLSSRTASAPTASNSSSWASVFHLDLDLDEIARVRARSFDGLPKSSRDGDVVVFDEYRVIEAVAVRATSAATHGVLLESAQPGGRLPGGDDLWRYAADGVLVSPRQGGDARQVAEKVQSRALPGQDGASLPGDARDGLTGIDIGAVLHEGLEGNVLTQHLEDTLGDEGARYAPVPTRDEGRNRTCLGRDDRVGRDVAGLTQVLAECLLDQWVGREFMRCHERKPSLDGQHALDGKTRFGGDRGLDVYDVASSSPRERRIFESVIFFM